jgi:hypothetical protein
LLTITGYAPTVDQTVGSGTNVAPDVGLLTITGYAPSVAQSANQEITPSAGQIVITGYPPDVVQSGQTAPIGGSGKVRRRYQIKIGQQVFEGSKEAVEQIARELAIEAAREEAQQPVPAIAEVVVQSRAKKPALLAATQAAADVQAAYAKALQQELMRLQDEDDEEALIALFT